jgi:hypothetical protein
MLKASANPLWPTLSELNFLASYVPGVVPSSNPGLKFANAFGVISIEP